MISVKDKDELRKLLLNPGTFATTLNTIVLDTYGTEAYGWDTQTLRFELVEDFSIKDMPRINLDKLNALISFQISDLFYKDWVAFNHVCEALSNDPIDFEILDPATPEQLAWAVVETSLLEDPEDKPEYSEEVRKYMGVILNTHGLTRKPSILKMAIMPNKTDAGIETFSGDKEMYLAYFNKQESDIDDIVRHVKTRFTQLMFELDAVPLQSRDAKAWKDYLQSARKSNLMYTREELDTFLGLGRESREAV